MSVYILFVQAIINRDFNLQGCKTLSVEMEEEEEKVLARADPNRQESLASEVVPDPMEGEQTWPTPEEMAEAEGEALWGCQRS